MMSTLLSLLPPGTLIASRYTLGPSIVQGERSVVYKAVDLTSMTSIVIKVLAGPSDDLARELYGREVRSLSLLRHPNIVRLLAAGEDDISGPWLALEYITGGSLGDIKDLTRFRSELELLNIMHGCSKGLQQAHLQSIIHRDLKPQNILLGDGDTPKLADFGISKLLGRWKSINTVRQMMTRRYASPEQLRGEPADEYSDVYSLGIVAAELLTGAVEADVPSLLERRLASAECSGSLRALLRRMISTERLERPTASAVLAELVDLMAIGDAAPKLQLHLTTTVLTRVAQLSGRATPGEALRAITTDLESPVRVSSDIRKAQNGQERYSVVGERFQYSVVISETEPRALKVINVGAVPPLTMDQRRHDALVLPALWRVNGPTAAAADASSASMFVDLFGEANAARQAGRVQGRLRNDLLDRWELYLDSQQDAGAGRERIGDIKHIRRGEDTSLLTVELFDTTRTSAEGTSLVARMVAISTADGMVNPLGMIVQHEDRYVVVRPHESLAEDDAQLRGTLLIDGRNERAITERQQRALRAVRRNGAVRSDLLDLLMDPATGGTPARTAIEPIQLTLDRTNQDAVELALGTPSIFLIQGPPGTGKTTVIAEFVCQVLRKQPDARILVSAQSNVAVDNVLERLESILGPIEALRIGHAEKIAPGLKRYELGERLGRLAATMTERAEGARDRLHRLRLATPEDVGTLEQLMREVAATDEEADAIQLGREMLGDSAPASAEELSRYLKAARMLMAADSASQQRIEALQAQWIDLSKAAAAYERHLFDSVNVVAGTCIGFAGRRLAADSEYDWVIVDEAGRATPPEALVPMVRGRRFLLVGDQRQLPPVIDKEAATAVERRMAVVDGRLTKSLFEELYEVVDESFKLRLTQQYRMHPEIGGLIAECFYPEGLDHGVESGDRTLGMQLLGAPLLWIDTSALAAREQQVETSYRNPMEATIIMKRLLAIERTAQKLEIQKRVTVGILTGYLPQEELLVSRLRSVSEERYAHLTVSVHTVDAAQGKEFDLVFYSAVRSNEHGKIGFLRDARRLNVALSRARDGLVIVGDAHALTAAVRGSNPFASVKAYFDASPRRRLWERATNA
jgi:serine/threonine-protein kinase